MGCSFAFTNSSEKSANPYAIVSRGAHRNVTKRVDSITHQKNTNEQGHNRRNVSNTCGRDRAKVISDVIVDDIGETRPAQPKTNLSTRA